MTASGRVAPVTLIKILQEICGSTGLTEGFLCRSSLGGRPSSCCEDLLYYTKPAPAGGRRAGAGTRAARQPEQASSRGFGWEAQYAAGAYCLAEIADEQGEP